MLNAEWPSAVERFSPQNRITVGFVYFLTIFVTIVCIIVFYLGVCFEADT
jgi:hypothetical protein